METKNKKQKIPAATEEHAVILDYLSLGYVNSDMSKFKGKAIAQAIGTDYFTLLELVPKRGVDLEIQDTVYIGKGKRDKIYKVLGKLYYENLTATSRIELEYSIREIVKNNEEKFVEFFNTAGAISTRLHKLELIPGIGKKYMWEIVEARRIPSLNNPAEMIVNRVKQELDTTTAKKGKKKYYLFTPIPKAQKKHRNPRNSRNQRK